jgi:hypothetical protein
MPIAYATSEPAADPRPGPTGMPCSSPSDEIPDDEEVVYEALLFEHVDLELVTLPHFLRIGAVAETLAQSRFRDLAQVLILRLPRGRLVVRILGRCIELETAALGNRESIVTGSGKSAKSARISAGDLK